MPGMVQAGAALGAKARRGRSLGAGSATINNVNQLLEIGFQACGHWLLNENRLACELTRFATQKNILYAFVSDGELMYVGKTVQPLLSRMGGYKNPAPSQTTNVRNNARIRELLGAGAVVEIFALPDNGLHRYGVFHLNLAAGLEDDIIRTLRPPWNGGKPEAVGDISTVAPEVLAVEEPPVRQAVLHRFTVALGTTYYSKGFFNVGVADQQWIGSDGEAIELFLGDAEEPVLGTINRRANMNGTPRLMGGRSVRDWFARSAAAGESLQVDVYSPHALRVSVAKS